MDENQELIKKEEIVEGDEELKESEPSVDYSESKIKPLPVVGKKKNKVQKFPKKTAFTLVRRVTTISTKAGTIFVVEDEDGVGYIAPGDVKFVRGQTELDVSGLDKAYDWEDEIEAMLPSREVMMQNIRRSFWISGGYAKGEGRKSRRMDQAWPYRPVEDGLIDR